MPGMWIASHNWLCYNIIGVPFVNTIYQFLSYVIFLHIKYVMILIFPLTTVFLISLFLFCAILFSASLCEHYVFEFWFSPSIYESLSFNGVIWCIHIIFQGMTFGKVFLLFSQTILLIFFKHKFWGQNLWEKLIYLFAHKLLLYITYFPYDSRHFEMWFLRLTDFIILLSSDPFIGNECILCVHAVLGAGESVWERLPEPSLNPHW